MGSIYCHNLKKLRACITEQQKNPEKRSVKKTKNVKEKALKNIIPNPDIKETKMHPSEEVKIDRINSGSTIKEEIALIEKQALLIKENRQELLAELAIIDKEN